jgi:hypothetical protein
MPALLSTWNGLTVGTVSLGLSGTEKWPGRLAFSGPLRCHECERQPQPQQEDA